MKLKVELINFTTVASHADPRQAMNMAWAAAVSAPTEPGPKASQASHTTKTIQCLYSPYNTRPLLYLGPRATTLYGALISYLVIAPHVRSPYPCTPSLPYPQDHSSRCGHRRHSPDCMYPMRSGGCRKSLSPIHHPWARWAAGCAGGLPRRNGI